MLNQEEWATLRTNSHPDVPPNLATSEEEAAFLFSLALDEQLDEAEAAKLEELLAGEPFWGAEWQTWQAMDATLRSAPILAPPAGFLAGVEQRLVQTERRRKLWAGATFAVIALLLWGSALTGVVSLGALVMARQDIWLNESIHNVTYWWVSTTARLNLLWTTALALVATPQAQAVVVCYAVMAVAILGGWIMFLRRSVRVSSTLAAS
jgi:anti-sigma factor RsiW